MRLSQSAIRFQLVKIWATISKSLILTTEFGNPLHRSNRHAYLVRDSLFTNLPNRCINRGRGFRHRIGRLARAER
jgi:hypothetical protein